MERLSGGPPLPCLHPSLAALRGAGSRLQELRALGSRTKPSRLGVEASCVSFPASCIPFPAKCPVTPPRLPPALSASLHSVSGLAGRVLAGCSWRSRTRLLVSPDSLSSTPLGRCPGAGLCRILSAGDPVSEGMPGSSSPSRNSGTQHGLCPAPIPWVGQSPGKGRAEASFPPVSPTG